MENQYVILTGSKNNAGDANVEVVFHHSITKNDNKGNLSAAHKSFIKWLTKNNIGYVDISGSAENLIEYYQDCDLHIGYRVHAHIFMSSISKPSILLNEDGHGIALRDVIGGLSFDAYQQVRKDRVYKILKKLNNYGLKVHRLGCD